MHFQIWFVVYSIILVSLTPFLTRYRKEIFALNVFAILVFLWGISPSWENLIPQERKSVHEPETVSIFFANINSQNSEKGKLVSYLRENPPDIVLLVEVNYSWSKELSGLESIYPYSKMIVRDGNFGMATLSRTPLEVENVFVDRENMIPALFLKAESSIGLLNLVLLHPFPPLGHLATIIRNQYLSALSHRISDFNSPLLVCGDFNTTPWSDIFKKFMQKSALDLNHGGLLRGTWPTTFFMPNIPVDHCLSRGLDFIKYDRGPDIGSDHWPLVIEIMRGNRNIARNQK